jgi:hypothetical protein
MNKQMFAILLTIACTAIVGCSHIAPGTQHSIQTKLGQRKYASQSTDELKLRRNQIIEMLGAGRKEIDIKIGSPLAMAMMDDDGKIEDLFKEKNEIERELLRRWKAGDEGAKVETFSQL